jgi:aminomethyltransferase
MKNTALTHLHQTLGAKMVPFAGYNMPVQYEGLNIEHETVRNSVGVFDVSHMGEFIIRGANAIDLIQKITSNDVSKLSDGKVQYSCFPNDSGGIVDDLLVYRIDEQTYMLVVNASNIEKDWNWIRSKNIRAEDQVDDDSINDDITPAAKQDGDTVVMKRTNKKVEMINISDKTSLLAVQGPKALATLQKLTDVNLSAMEYYSFKKGRFAGVDNVLISATGYTGAGGFEVYFENAHAVLMWNSIFEAGKEFGIKPIGLGARDTLRLEMGYCLYGNDIDDSTSPIEAGLGWITKFNKNFTNSSALLEQKNKGTARKLVGFEMIERGIPRHDYPILDSNNQTIGKVTSGTMSPTLKLGIGMGYVKTEFSKPGSEIYVQIRDKSIKAKVVKLPFLKPNV